MRPLDLEGGNHLIGMHVFGQIKCLEAIKVYSFTYAI